MFADSVFDIEEIGARRQLSAEVSLSISGDTCDLLFAIGGEDCKRVLEIGLRSRGWHTAVGGLCSFKRDDLQMPLEDACSGSLSGDGRGKRYSKG